MVETRARKMPFIWKGMVCACITQGVMTRNLLLRALKKANPLDYALLSVKQLVGMACSLFLITTWLWPLAFPRSKSSVCPFRIGSALANILWRCVLISYCHRTSETQSLCWIKRLCINMRCCSNNNYSDCTYIQFCLG